MTGKKVLRWIVQNRMLVILLLLLTILTLKTDKFWTLRNLQFLLEAMSINGVMVVGMTVVMIGAGLDLSIGSIMAMCGIIVVSLMKSIGLPAAIVVAVLAGAFFGAMNGFFITKLRINPFIATLGTMITVRGLAMTITDGHPVAISHVLFSEIGRGKVMGFPIPGIIFLVVVLLGIFFLRYTITGRNVYAYGGNEEAARASGIQINQVKMVSYILSGLTAGISGVVLASRLSTGSPVIGEDTSLAVITAVLLGGTSLSGGVGTIGGSLIGLLSVSVLSNGMNLLNIPAYYQRVAMGALLLFVIIVDSLYTRSRRRALSRTRGKQQDKLTGHAAETKITSLT
jgi:ribose/xylose/arabinose/galactoside ABC-type transport system permease subunit